MRNKEKVNLHRHTAVRADAKSRPLARFTKAIGIVGVFFAASLAAALPEFAQRGEPDADPTDVLETSRATLAPLADSEPEEPGEPTDLGFSAEWDAALGLLRSMPVQDAGFARSAMAFAENVLPTIAAKRRLHNVPAFEVVLRLAADPRARHAVRAIKVYHPELAEILGGGYTSLSQYLDPRNQIRMLELLRGNESKWMKPLTELQRRAERLEHVEADFAFLPRADEWLSPVEAVRSGDLDHTDRRILESWNALAQAIRTDDAVAGTQASETLVAAVRESAKIREIALPNLTLDVFYHTHRPFRKSARWYVFAALAYAAAWLLARPRIAWIGYGFLAAGFAFQAVGIAARWILSGRAPVANMFESFVFAVAGMVLIALILEAVHRTRLIGLGASVLGFVFVVLAHEAPIFDSRIRPLMPALQSSWLTYHVVTIMLSYSAFALSFFVAVVYLAKDALARRGLAEFGVVQRLPSLEALDTFNYRIIGIGFPLLTAGIVLGAMWAGTAWGRPWGFDPKETWSAITWAVYAIYIHIRLLSGWKGRGAAWFSILGFLSVLFTYFGVNYLLPGLHSYV